MWHPVCMTTLNAINLTKAWNKYTRLLSPWYIHTYFLRTHCIKTIFAHAWREKIKDLHILFEASPSTMCQRTREQTDVSESRIYARVVLYVLWRLLPSEQTRLNTPSVSILQTGLTIYLTFKMIVPTGVLFLYFQRECWTIIKVFYSFLCHIKCTTCWYNPRSCFSKYICLFICFFL